MRFCACYEVSFGLCYPDSVSRGSDRLHLGTYTSNHRHGREPRIMTTQLEAKCLGPRWAGIKRSSSLFTRPTLRPPPGRSALFKHDGPGRWMCGALNMVFQASVTSRTADGILAACSHPVSVCLHEAGPVVGYTPSTILKSPLATPSPSLASALNYPHPVLTLRAVPSFPPGTCTWRPVAGHLTCRKSSDTFVRGLPFRLACGRAGIGKDSV